MHSSQIIVKHTDLNKVYIRFWAVKKELLKSIKKQAGFAEPHSSSTIGWVGVGLRLGFGSPKKLVS